MSLPPAVWAQDLIARSFSMEDGLVNSQIYSIFEDRDGFLWIGTWDGISRFDGVTFTNFQQRDGLPLGRVLAFHQSPDGTFYLGGEGGAVVFDGERFLPLPEESRLAGPTVFVLAGLPDGTVLFGGLKGLVARRPDGGFEHVLSSDRSPLSGAAVTALLPARDGTVYVGTTGRGVFAWRGGQISRLEGLGGERSPAVYALHAGRDGTIYAGTVAGLKILREGSVYVPPSARGQRIESIAEDDAGNLYAATFSSGVLRFRTATLEPLTPLTMANGLSHDAVHVVHAVRGGPVFFGTDAGLSVFGGGAVETWASAHGLPGGTVWSLAEDAQGLLYAAAWKGGAVALREGQWHRLGLREGGPQGLAISVHSGSSGRFYTGDDQGRVRISESGRLLQVVQLPEKGYVIAIVEGPGGVAYASTFWKVWKIQGHEVARLPVPQDSMTHSLAMAADGTLYLGTSQGLLAFNEGVSRKWTRRQGLADDFVTSVKVGRDGSVYAGTRGGLSVLRGGRIETYDASDGLTSPFVTCVLEDGEGRLYLSTHRGVHVLDRVRGQPRILPVYGLGLRAGVTGACLRDHRGRLWFGIHPALTMYDPAKDHRPRTPPKIRLTGLQVFQDRMRPVPQAFAHDRNDLTFSFTGIDLAAHFMRFRYRLAGLDRKWVDTDQRSTRYPNLLPGDYRFEVQARNDAGLWSAPAGLSFTILAPPWWRRPALVLGLAAAGVALAAGLFAVYRVRQLLEVERLRAGIAADLHDQVGAGLTDIAILSEVAARKAGGLPELDRIAATAREMVDGLGDIVWLVNPRRDSLYELFLRLKDSYAELFAHTGAELEVGDLSPFEGVRLSMAWRQDLHLLFKEALHNALRHSGCRRAELSVTLHGRRLEVVLQDHGRGFDPERCNGNGEGLATMRRRAGRLGGRLEVESSPGGTTVRFTGMVP